MRSWIVVALLVTAMSASPAQVIGKYAGEFLAIGVGGRALGLGGAHAALASDATAGYWNPAALARIGYPELMLMHDERFGSLLNYDFAAVAIPSGAQASLGLSVIRLGVDGIPDTRNAWVDVNGNGLFDDDNRPEYDKITYFSAADWGVLVTYATRAGETFAYGANLKLIYRDLAEASGTGLGFDVGALYTPVEGLSFGANVQDITTTFIAWSTGRTELITPTLKLGSAYEFEFLGGRFAPTVDVDLRFENRRFASVASIGSVSLDPRLGIEFDLRRTIALRVGYSDVRQLTLGAGLHLRKLDIDYCFARFGSRDDNLGDTHRISLRLVLEEERFARL
jgi:hypothetical protein